MVRLGIISDSHSSAYWTERFLTLANKEKYDAVFHLGDGEGETRMMKRKLRMPLLCVAGNCDMFSKLPGELVADYEGVRLLAVHGHRYDVKWGLDQLSYHAEEQGAKVALYGHTHIPNVEYVGPVLMINPGALMRGRYAELVIENGRITPFLKEFGD